MTLTVNFLCYSSKQKSQPYNQNLVRGFTTKNESLQDSFLIKKSNRNNFFK